MPRHDRAYGEHWSKRARGRAHGIGKMKRWRNDAGMTREQFAELLRRLAIRAR